MVFVMVTALSSGPVRANDTGPANGNPYNKFSFGLSGGMFTSLTDVKELPFLPDSDEITYGGRLMLNVHFSPVLTLQGNFLYGELKGIETQNNLAFETDLIESTLNLRISINGLFVPASRVNQSVNLYGFIGVGALAYRSRLLQAGVPISYYGYTDGGQTADDLKLEFVAPYGLGVNFRISERMDIGIADMKSQHDSDVETVRRDVRQLTQKQEQLNRRPEQVFRALEDITQQIIELEAKIDAQPERYYSVQVMALREELSLAEARSYLGINTDLEMVYDDGVFRPR